MKAAPDHNSHWDRARMIMNGGEREREREREERGREREKREVW